MSVINHCMKYRKIYFEANGDLPKNIRLNGEQFNELLGCSEFLPRPSGPQPPMVEHITEHNRSVFGTDTIKTHKIYDYENPQYLKALESFDSELKQFMIDYPNGKILGMKIIVEG